MRMRNLVVLTVSVVLFLVSAAAFADRPTLNPKVEEKLKDRQGPGSSVYAPLMPTGSMRLGEKKEIVLPPRDTYYYGETGEKITLTPNPAYLTIRFTQDISAKGQRVKYYREKVRMIVGELRPKELMDLGLFGVRLQPGGTVQQVNHLMEYMKGQEETLFISRVFTGEKTPKSKFPPLLFTLDEIELTPNSDSDAELSKLEKNYPIKRKKKLAGKSWRFTVLGKSKDPVDLANELVNTKSVLMAKPLFVEVKTSKSIKPIDTNKLIQNGMRGIMQNAIQNPQGNGKAPKQTP